jgi:uncharacterized protein YjiS (DUF1127 family)
MEDDMSAMQTTGSAAAGASVWALWFPALVARLIEEVRQRIEIRNRRRLLHAMPDFLLKDIGIYRSDIDALVESAVRGQPDWTRHPLSLDRFC